MPASDLDMMGIVALDLDMTGIVALDTDRDLVGTVDLEEEPRGNAEDPQNILRYLHFDNYLLNDSQRACSANIHIFRICFRSCMCKTIRMLLTRPALSQLCSFLASS